MKILVIGGASYDDIIHVDEFFEPKSATVFVKKSYSKPGSTGIGKSIALKRLGYDVTFIAAIGDDYYGKVISQMLKDEGIKFYPLEANKTERHTNIMNRFGERITIFTQTSDIEDIFVNAYEKQVKEADIVVLNIKDYSRYFIPLLKKYQKQVYCDIHDYDGYNTYHKDFIMFSDYIFMSSDNIKDYKNYMYNLLKDGKKWVVVTHAKKGASGLDGHEFIEISSNQIEVIDTNGAGDNFFAGMLHGYLNMYSMQDCLYLGRIVAESCIQSEKVVSDMLNLKYLEKYFEKLKNIS